jgi:hypothetical protein
MTTVLDLDTASKWLCEQLTHQTAGFAVGKIGTSELNALMFYLQREKALPYPQYIVREMTENAGFWSPANSSIDDTLDLWAQNLVEALANLDAVVSWSPSAKTQELLLLNQYSPNAKKIVLRALEPYYTPANQYTMKMTKGPIAVVSPFTESITKQWSVIQDVFPTSGLAGQMWPKNQTLIPIRAPYGPAMTQANLSLSWPSDILNEGPLKAVQYLAEQVTHSGAKYALVGIGALSLLLVHELKKRDIVAIHTGGGTQIMFGIKGNRWQNHSVISNFFNPSWTKPSQNEIPSEAQKVERSCYW